MRAWCLSINACYPYVHINIAHVTNQNKNNNNSISSQNKDLKTNSQHLLTTNWTYWLHAYNVFIGFITLKYQVFDDKSASIITEIFSRIESYHIFEAAANETNCFKKIITYQKMLNLVIL